MREDGACRHTVAVASFAVQANMAAILLSTQEDVEFEREMNKLRQWVAIILSFPRTCNVFLFYARMQAVSKRMYKDMRKCNDTETGISTCFLYMRCYGDVICMLPWFSLTRLAWMRCGQRMVSDIKSSALGRSEPLKHTVRYTHCLYCEHHDMIHTLKSRSIVIG